MEVIIYSSPDDKKKNRGFCFLEYESHKAASLAKRLVVSRDIYFLVKSYQLVPCAQATGDGSDQGVEL